MRDELIVFGVDSAGCLDTSAPVACDSVVFEDVLGLDS